MKKTNKILLLIIAVLLAIILLPCMFIYSLIVSIYNGTVDEFCRRNAVIIDLAGNVNGELIEDLVVKENVDDTLFGETTSTISSSLGELQEHNLLNSKGIWLNKLLDKAFNMDNHSKMAYLEYLDIKPKNIQR